MVKIVPEEAIYPCLNAPENMPDYIRSWFDEGLKNYSPAMPIPRFLFHKFRGIRAENISVYLQGILRVGKKRFYYIKNYSPAMPIYGLSKRQCGRVALFSCIKRVTKVISKCVSAFEGSDMSLEIVITGNLGDVFFGGMFIDLAYIVKALFAER